VDIYEGVNGLDYDACLGSDWNDWLADDLFTFTEMNEYDLRELINSHVFILVPR